MPTTLEDMMLGYMERQRDQHHPAWVNDRLAALDDMLQLDQLPFPERDRMSNAITDVLTAGQLSGFIIGIRFALDVLKEIE